MRKHIFGILEIIILIFIFLYMQMYFIIYNIKVKDITNNKVMLTIFGQDFVCEYNVK